MSALGELIRDHGTGAQEHEAILKIGDKTVKLYAKPLTGLDIEKIQKRHPRFPEQITMSAVVDILIHKVTDAQGNKAFDPSDKQYLLAQPLSWLSKLRADLFPEDDLDFSDDALEDAEKN